MQARRVTTRSRTSGRPANTLPSQHSDDGAPVGALIAICMGDASFRASSSQTFSPVVSSACLQPVACARGR